MTPLANSVHSSEEEAQLDLQLQQASNLINLAPTGTPPSITLPYFEQSMLTHFYF